ncbi:MAG: hypothetical protein GDA42_05710 [Ekhidna sp.]|nr:hypothetical protein [Ekhidna sp.]MBC6409940.1 hypothetical protein [Ekhidna sp.]
MNRKGYHTQENRGSEKLENPIKCCRDDAWFGEAHYFWENVDDADYWGKVSKRATGQYDVYHSNIDCSNFLDTVFNEEHYRVWLSSIEKLALKFERGLGKKLSLKELNDYFRTKGLYKEVDGVVFQDISANKKYFLIKSFQYKKRIQLAIFNEKMIKDFIFLHTKKSYSYDRYK